MIVELFGKNYYLDLNKISEFIYYSNSHPLKESEITDSYGTDDNSNEKGEFGVVSKLVRETTTQGIGQIDNLRYDLVKMLIQQLLSFGYDDEDREAPPFGFEVTINTLIKEGFLKEINN